MLRCFGREGGGGRGRSGCAARANRKPQPASRVAPASACRRASGRSSSRTTAPARAGRVLARQPRRARWGYAACLPRRPTGRPDHCPGSRQPTALPEPLNTTLGWGTWHFSDWIISQNYLKTVTSGAALQWVVYGQTTSCIIEMPLHWRVKLIGGNQYHVTQGEPFSRSKGHKKQAFFLCSSFSVPLVSVGSSC